MTTLTQEIEALDYGQTRIICDHKITRWAETYELNTKSGKKENSFKHIDMLVRYIEKDDAK